MSAELITLLIVAAAVISIVTLCLMSRAEQDAFDGRRLREAAGSRAAIEMAIESANLDRLLSAKYENEFERVMRREVRKPPRNVINFVPRISSGGRVVKFTPDGDAA